ncbi:Methyltransferase type 11 [Dehalogenimonas lykanthroporepellens BL-DC-9]|nr:Methyltransferase type 11 [Dehalogenimonas lykanthroporepellens BL-DC-9]
MAEEHAFPARMAERLDNPGRLAELRIPELLCDIGGVEAGMTCIDLGAGTGTFTRPLGVLVGSAGRVYAVDASPELLELLKAKKPPEQVTVVTADFTATGLDTGIADFCLTAFVLHETRALEALLKEAFRLLKTDGRLLVVEWRAELEAPGPPKNIRMTPERLGDLLAEAGFTGFAWQNWTEKHYFATAEKE